MRNVNVKYDNLETTSTFLMEIELSAQMKVNVWVMIKRGVSKSLAQSQISHMIVLAIGFLLFFLFH